MIRRALLACLLAVGLSISIGATEIGGANIPITQPGLIATATLNGAVTNAFVSVSVQSPGTGTLIVDVAESLDGGVTWDEFASTLCGGAVYPPNPYGLPVGANSVCGFGFRIRTNTAGAQFRVVVRSVSGGLWTVLSVDVTS